MYSFAPTSLCLYDESPADTPIALLSRALPASIEIKKHRRKGPPSVTACATESAWLQVLSILTACLRSLHFNFHI